MNGKRITSPGLLDALVAKGMAGYDQELADLYREAHEGTGCECCEGV